jgi:hypothetical protein
MIEMLKEERESPKVKRSTDHPNILESAFVKTMVNGNLASCVTTKLYGEANSIPRKKLIKQEPKPYPIYHKPYVE